MCPESDSTLCLDRIRGLDASLAPAKRQRVQVALVLLSGRLGGAETFSAQQAEQTPDQGVDEHVVLIEDAGGEYPERLDRLGVEYTVCGAKRVGKVIDRSRHFAPLVTACDRDTAIVSWPGARVARKRARSGSCAGGGGKA